VPGYRQTERFEMYREHRGTRLVRERRGAYSYSVLMAPRRCSKPSAK
jgi:hypothetical protein